jgi:plasmid replication initiation protein
MSSSQFSIAKHEANLAKIAERVAARKAEEGEEVEDDGQSMLPGVIPEALSSVAKSSSSLRKVPPGDAQLDFFVPAVYDLATKDTRSTMDVAVFRLSKKDKRPNTTVRCELTNGYVEIASGSAGMASVWDYDVILMAISHLMQAVNQHRAGKGEMPGRVFRPSVAEILKFCRRSDGGRQYDEIEAVLDRLHTTTVKVVRTVKGRGGKEKRVGNAEAFITRYRTVADSKSGRVATVEMEIADWIYEEVAVGSAAVLTMHEDYFRIKDGIGRFVYRLARRSAGKTTATWKFKTLYERSNSTGEFKEFCRMLRKGILASNDLPHYDIVEVQGQDGPMIQMTHREHVAGQDDRLAVDGG